mgnify:CR=1 FL=1
MLEHRSKFAIIKGKELSFLRNVLVKKNRSANIHTKLKGNTPESNCFIQIP